MKKMLCFLALSLTLLAQPTLAQDKSIAKMLVGEWHCTQNLNPEEGINLNVEYTQLFTAQRNFTLDGSMDMAFDVKEMNAMFGSGGLKYLFEGSGSWLTKPNLLTIKTENATMTPNSPMAQQMHDAGIMDVNELREMKSEDDFTINSLTKNSLVLTHTKEDFSTQCTRTK